MDWIVGLLLLVVGMIIGFFISKFFVERKFAEQASKQNENTVKEIMAQNATDHISQTRDIVTNLQSRCDDLVAQLDAYENVLIASQTDDTEKLTYFGEQATVYIRHQQAKQKRKSETPEFQPRDFSGERTGLFTDAKNKQVVDEK
ncbi:ZapG family protein [Aliiglaciecola lipolytica]|uniref:DUF1043 domain-containing protein n=1 Tax=Aliiglaciecola lipolytica E3 TaxID=1127673 RepID=K6YCB8_9ALTE|nr:DUF1043 family protein [Aliiglaciecola lipolytica]GAC15817.1 hypothetical protein GLIP_3200 [Aliiglaciecola lipolytica E3]